MKNVGINCRVMESLSVQNNCNTYLHLFLIGHSEYTIFLCTYDQFVCFYTFNAKFDELINNVMV